MKALVNEITLDGVTFKIGDKVAFTFKSRKLIKDMWIVSINYYEGLCNICIVDENGEYDSFDNNNYNGGFIPINLKVV